MLDDELKKQFLSNVKKYKKIPPLIKNSSCDIKAKLCKKDGLVELVKSTKTGNTYAITPKGRKFLKNNVVQFQPYNFGF